MLRCVHRQATHHVDGELIEVCGPTVPGGSVRTLPLCRTHRRHRTPFGAVACPARVELVVPGPDPRVQVPPNCDLTLGMICLDKSVPGRTVWQMVADERFANPVGVLQGGFLAAMADSAMGATSIIYAQREGRKIFSANAEMKVSFLRPVTVGTTLTCVADVLSGGLRVAFVEALITDSEGTMVAKATSTYILTPRQPRDGSSGCIQGEATGTTDGNERDG